MHLSRALAALLLLVATTAGCVSNMDDLKLKLGAVEAPPAVLAPLAKAQANATSTLVELPLRFSADGSKDPQGLPLAYTWYFGDDAQAHGALVTHAYARAGEYVARVTVVNGAGLADTAEVTIQVAPGNHKPVALASGPANGTMGARLAFDGSASRDADGDPLTFAWDFGDGATALAAQATHAYAAPGVYHARLRVTDAHGATDEATLAVPVAGAWAFDGSFDPAASAPQSRPVVVAEGATRFVATLTFPAGVGNDLTLVAKDASGREVARAAAASGTPTPPTGTIARTIALPASALTPPGVWTLVVEPTMAPAGVSWTLDVTESLT
jgi:PKD repeat protein